MVEYELTPNASRNFIVYMHTNPLNNKRYIGVTGRGLQNRSGPNGCRYKGNKHFYNAIQKVGWDNIKHEILLNGLTKQQAGMWEYYLINMYDTTNPDNGYNNREGGFIHSGYSFSNKISRTKSSLVKFTGLYDGQFFVQSEYSNIKVSNLGRILVFEGTEWKLATFPQTMPYYTIYINDVDKNRRCIPVHQLVYFTLHGIKVSPIPAGYCIMHLDCNKHNNCIQNLAYATISQCSLNEKYNLGRTRTKPVNQYSLDGKYLFTYASAQIAAKTINRNSSIHTRADSISKCASGYIYKSYGYQWRFVCDFPEGIDISPVKISVNGKRKRIAQYGRDGTLVKIWQSGRDAMRAFDRKSPSSIYKCADGKNNTAWGYIWKWA